MSHLPEGERERDAIIARKQMRQRLTRREPWLRLGPEGKLLFRVARFFAILFVVSCVTFRTLIGGSTISWNQRLTVIVDTPAGEVRGSSVVKISNTETMGVLVPPEARGVRGEVRGEAVAVEVLPGRWLFALLSGGERYKGDAAQLVYSAFRLGETRKPTDRSYESNMEDLRAQPRDTPAPIPPEAYPLLVTFDDITRPETVREVDPADLAATFGAGVNLRDMTLEVTGEDVTEGLLEELLEWLGKSPEPHLMSGDGRITDVPFAMTVAFGDFLAAPQ